jgi:hypothetical protein
MPLSAISSGLPGLLLAATILPFSVPARAAAVETSTTAAALSPEAVKAAFLVNFVRFTDWPKGNPAEIAPYSIGVSGNRQIEDELIRLADRQLVRGHRLRIVRIKSPADLAGLHVAYFDTATAEIEGMPGHEALALLRTRPVLTISDDPGFLAAGGIIRIFREGKAVRFEIAPQAAREAGLVLSSRLLALASIYRSDNRAAARYP